MRRQKATSAEQTAMRAIWPDGLPPGSMNERIEREAKAPHAFIPVEGSAECGVLCCDKTADQSPHTTMEATMGEEPGGTVDIGSVVPGTDPKCTCGHPLSAHLFILAPRYAVSCQYVRPTGDHPGDLYNCSCQQWRIT